jgi:hypothetical protein
LKSLIKNIAIPEFKSLVGKGFSRLITVSALFAIAIIASGIAASFDAVLNKKMNSDPYIRCIDIERRTAPVQGKALLDEDGAKEYYKLYKNTYSIEKFQTASLTYEKFIVNDNEKQVKGMVLEENNEFYKDFDKNQFLHSKNSFKDNTMSLIITQKFLDQFKISIDELEKNPFIIVKKNNNNIPIPISAIVRKLNYNCSFAITKSMRQADRDKFSINNYNDRSTYFVPYSYIDNNEIPLSFRKMETAGKSVADVCFVDGEIYLSTDTNAIVPKQFIKIYDIIFESTNNISNLQSDFISFFLYPEGFSKIDVLSEDLFEKYGIEFENSRIETKNNYEIFKEILNFLSFLLVVFSCLSIIIFTINTVVSHLNSNKKSLGTLKAFGLTNQSIVLLYSCISFLMISISFSFAYFIAQCFGDFILLSILDLIPGNLSGSFVNAHTGFLSLMIIIPMLSILAKVFIYLNNKTPGDLIYERK